MNEEERETRSCTLSFLCSLCHFVTYFTRELARGNNALEFTCAQCGEHWHAEVELVALDQLAVGTTRLRRVTGKLYAGRFWRKEELQ